MFPLSSSLLHCRHRNHHHHHHHLLLFLRRKLSTDASTIPQSPHLQIPLSFPTYLICSSNTSLGKTLVSTGIAASFLLSSTHSHSHSHSLPPKKFLYLKPVQTGFPSDSDSRFVFSKLTSLAGRRHTIRRSLLASDHVLKASRSAGGVPLEDCEQGMFDLGSYSECRVLGKEGGEASELVCKTLFSWRDAVSPHLAAEREKGTVEDSTVLEILQGCLERGLDGWDSLNVFSVVETAGGVASPGPSGTLQCDLYR